MTSTADLVTESVADLRQKQEKTFKTMTNKERLIYIKEVITVEPLIAAYLMASIICSPALLNLEFEKGCRSNLNLNDTVCDAILTGENDNYTKENDEIQKLIAQMHSWQTPVQSVMPLILVLFLGSYSDRHQMRKPFLLLPIFGEFFAVAGCMLCVFFMKDWPLEAQGIAQTVVPSLFGGPSMIIMAVFAYIADVSTVEMRTLRVGIIQIVLNVCTPVGQAISGILFAKIGYYGVLSIAAFCYIFAVLYGIFWIKEPKKPDVVLKKSFIADAFDPKHAIETFKLLFKTGDGNNRLFLWVVLLILFVYSLIVTGEGTIFYLYVQKFFNWTPLEYSYFITINTVIHLVGVLIGVPLFTKFLEMGDLMILVVTFIDRAVTSIIFGMAQSVVMLYVATAVSIIVGITPIAIRSMATKIVSPDDMGKAQSLFGICEAIGPAVASPLYNALYVATLNTLPAAYFYFGAILYVTCILIVIWMYFVEKSKKNIVQKQPPSTINEKSTDDFQMTHI